MEQEPKIPEQRQPITEVVSSVTPDAIAPVVEPITQVMDSLAKRIGVAAVDMVKVFFDWRSL